MSGAAQQRAARQRPGAGALCAAALEVDHALAEMDRNVDWLARLTAVNMDEIWEGFRSSGFRSMPESRFAEGLDQDAPMLREKLFNLPVDDIENTLIKALMLEKLRELDRQIELVNMRGREGFILASLDLFGPVSERLLETALDLLDSVPVLPPDELDAGAQDLCLAASRAIEGYRGQSADFDCKVIVDPTPGTSLYVSQGNFHVAHDYRTSHCRVEPLIAHEVGTHALTRHNGERQPLHTLAGGLADYDDLQEGLAVLGEYLTGYLPPERLRILAARVIAAHMAVEEAKGPEIFACLREEHAIEEKDAFDTAVRAKRGGGLTKDALYLKGLAELLAYLGHGGDLEILFLGKFALKHLTALEKMIEDGIVHPPELLPTYCQGEEANRRLAAVRSTPLASLYQERPER